MPLVTCRLAIGFALAVALAACRRTVEDAPCNAVAARLLALAQAEARAASVDDKLRQRVMLQLPALRDSVEQSCVSGRWAAAARACMVAAKDGATFAACQESLSDEQRERLRSASGAAAAP